MVITTNLSYARNSRVKYGVMIPMINYLNFKTPKKNNEKNLLKIPAD